MKVFALYNMPIEDLFLVFEELVETFLGRSKSYRMVKNVDCKQTYDPLPHSSGHRSPTIQISK